jgi:hypothetical protein
MYSRVTLSNSVGRNGVNLDVDVLKVKQLINANLPIPLRPFEENGDYNDGLAIAIELFQIENLPNIRPDGKVDKAGQTLNLLNRLCSQATPNSKVDSRLDLRPTAQPATAAQRPPQPTLGSATPTMNNPDALRGPFVINDLSLMDSLPGKDAVINVPKYGVQCVGLVQTYTDVGATDFWVAGSRVMSVPNLAKGTAIATFNEFGRYMSMPSGNHACFFNKFAGVNKIEVLEQHVSWDDRGRSDPNKIQTRTLKTGATNVSSDASAYSVVMVGTTSARAERAEMMRSGNSTGT